MAEKKIREIKLTWQSQILQVGQTGWPKHHNLPTKMMIIFKKIIYLAGVLLYPGFIITQEMI